MSPKRRMLWPIAGHPPLAALALLTLLGCVAGDEEAPGRGGPRGGPGGGPPAMPVDVAIAISDTVRDELVAAGEIEAVQAIELRPEVDGRIVRILVREGSEVGRGAGLFKVDDAELSAQVARLEADRDLARQALERTRALLAQDAASQAEYEQAEARARSSQAELDLQQVRLDRTLVRAPFSGVVGERSVSIGDYVTSSTALVTLQTVDPQRASFAVPERYAAALSVGQRVGFEVAAVSGREFVGEVDFVDPRVELPGRTIRVKASVSNADRALQAGMFIEARLAIEVRPDAVLVPESAVVQLDAGPVVWVVGSGGQAFRRDIELGVRMPGVAEVKSGVEAGETVITAGMERLFEGAPVMPRQAIDTGAPPEAGGQPGAGGPPGAGGRPSAGTDGAPPDTMTGSGG
ncbi:MAG: efflux RND transporter periplasmic adaptor subunit [Gemmatimonadota bacterium]|nr:efflux RND transporter periplasmic adaptor subunit [Gemmatimonadota bacterium]